jgi:hypothetical protein
MPIRYFLILCLFTTIARAQLPHVNAHAHNDYEHTRPLFDALQNRFTSVEADVHLQNNILLVSHDRPLASAPTLEALYLKPLDSMVNKNGGSVYPDFKGVFYLMIDIKTEPDASYQALKSLINQYPKLLCKSSPCNVKIFLSGERPLTAILREGYIGLALDGRPEDLSKEYSAELMPVISDTYLNWSRWDGKTVLKDSDLLRIKDLATRVHAVGKQLRLWAIPDNPTVWQALLQAGVDLLNTDKLNELNLFLTSKGR